MLRGIETSSKYWAPAIFLIAHKKIVIDHELNFLQLFPQMTFPFLKRKRGFLPEFPGQLHQLIFPVPKQISYQHGDLPRQLVQPLLFILEPGFNQFPLPPVPTD